MEMLFPDQVFFLICFNPSLKVILS